MPIGPFDRRMSKHDGDDTELPYTSRQNNIADANLYLSPPPRGPARNGSHVTVPCSLYFTYSAAEPCARYSR